MYSAINEIMFNDGDNGWDHNDNHDNDNTYDGEDEPFSLWQSVAEVFEAIKEIPCRDAMIALLPQQRRVTKQFNSIVILLTVYLILL